MGSNSISNSGTSNQIVFVDARVQDIQSLLSDLSAGIEVHVLDASQDGLAQINQVLAGRIGIDAIHVFSHGSAGAVQLGDTLLSSANLNSYASQLASIGQSLTESGDLLLYGCNVGAGAAGQSFVESIARITQADVAASDDLTGAANKGGDWVLEASAGKIQTESFALPGYGFVLDAHTYSGAANTTIYVDSDTTSDVTVTNNGTGTVTVAYLKAWPTVTTFGTGNVTVDANGFDLGRSGFSGPFTNNGSGILTLKNIPDTQTFSLGGTGPVTIIATADGGFGVLNAGSRSLTLLNNATYNTLTVNGVTGGTITNAGTKASNITYVDNPTGNLTVNNTGSSHLTIVNLDASTSAVQLSQSGTGRIDVVHGALTLTSDDTVTLTLNGNGTTVMKVNNGGYGDATGTVSLGDAQLTLNLASGYTPVAGNKIWLIDNDQSDAVTGIFAGKAQGSTIAVGGYSFSISYTYGTTSTNGNDVVLTALAPNAAPTIAGLPGSAQAVSTGVAAALDNFTVADVNNDSLTVTLTATNGTINNLTDADTNTAGIQLTGTAATINTAIAGATFTATADGAASIGISVSDGTAAPVTGTYALTASTPVNSFANLNGDTSNWGGINTTTNLDTNSAATVSHADPAATHWNGAALTVQRATSSDQNATADIFGFGASGALFTVSGNALQSAGQTFATFTNANGVLTISFANGGTDATNALVDNVIQRITYRNDTPYGDATLRFAITDAAGSASADVTAKSGSVFIDNATDTATIDRSNGVSFSEAIAIAAGDAVNGQNNLYLGAGLENQTVSMSAASTLTESLSVDFDLATTTTLAGGTLSIDATKLLLFRSLSSDSLNLQGVIAGAGNVYINSSDGSVTFSGNNTYSGTTTIGRGTLAVTDQSNLGTTSSIIISPASFSYDVVLQLNGSSGTISSNIVTTPRSGMSGFINTVTGTHTLSGVISGTGGLNFMGSGTLLLTNADTYSGATDVALGATLQVDGSIANTASVSVSGTLQGTGSIGTLNSKGAVSILNGGSLAAAGASAAGALTLNNGLTFATGAHFKTDLLGTTAGTQYDQSVVKGAVAVSGASLEVNLGSFVPNTGDSFVLIDNDGADAITGQVMVNGTTLAEGDSFVVGSKTFTVSYVDGNGNDLGLTVITPVNTLKRLDADSVGWAGVAGTVALDFGTNAGASHADPAATHWNGATLTVQRSGTAITSDTFAFDTIGANFTASGGNLQDGSAQTFGTYTSANGVLSISFANGGADASNALIDEVLQRVTYRNDTPAGDATIRFSLTPASASAVTAEVTVTTDKIYVTNGTSDTATIDRSNGVNFSEAIAIANAQSGANTLVLSSDFASISSEYSISATALSTSLTSDTTIDASSASGSNGRVTTLTGGALDTAGYTLGFTNTGATSKFGIATNLTGTGNLAKSGTGILTLSGTNTYSGTTSITGGKILANSTSLGTSAITLEGGTLGFGTTGSWTLANAITLGAGGGTLESSSGNSGGTTNVSGIISGGNLTLTSGDMGTGNPSNGIVYLTGANTYTGTTTLALNAGTGMAKIAGDGNLGAGNIIFTSGQLYITGNTVIDNAIQTNGSYSASFTVASGTTTEITGNISNLSGIAGLSSNGSGGTLKLSGTNNYSGSTYVGGGNTLIASSDAALPDATQLELGGGTLTLLSNQTVGALNPYSASTSASVINLSTYNLTLGSNNDSKFAGAINGSGNIVKNGSGTFTVTSSTATANTGDHSGNITVNAGVLQLDGTLKGPISVASDGKLSGGGADAAAGDALGNVSVASGGTLSPGASGGIATADLKTGNLSIASGGTLTMNISGTTAGATSSGYDQLITTGTVDVTGATLSVTGSYNASVGDSFVLVANDGVDLVTGTFNGLAEGASVTVNGTPMKLSYVGGTGNDITLTAQMAFSALAISADTGTSPTDFITNTLSQTITATLSSALGSTGVTIWGSVDNGTNWTDVTSMVSGTTLTWTGATLAGSDTIKLEARNVSSLVVGSASQAYVLDTTGPATTVDTVTFSADTGTSSTDFITKTAAQTISGTLSAVTVTGEKVQVSLDNGGTWTDATNVLGESTWTTNQTLVGSNTFKVRVVDTAGNPGTERSQAYVLDQTGPSITFSAIDISADTGIVDTDFITNTASQTITATLSALPSGSDKVYGSVNGGGTWVDITSMVSGSTLTWTGATLSGSSSIKLKVTDNAANDGTIASQSYVLDTAAPTASVVAAHVTIGIDVGTGQSTETGAIYLISTTYPSAITDLASLLTALNVAGGGAEVTSIGTNTPIPTVNLVDSTPMAAGTYKVYALDAAGNVSQPSTGVITLGTPPSITGSAVAFSADTGTSNTDLITRTAAQTISGTLTGVTATGDTVEVSLDNGSTWVTASNTVGQSSWSLAGQTLVGSDTLKVRVSNDGFYGNAYSAAYVLDTTAPATTVSATLFSADTGTSNTDLLTNTAAQTVSGTLSANLVLGEIVQVSMDNGGTWVSASASVGSNSWSLAGQTLTGSGTVKVRVADEAGNTGSEASHAYVLDTSAPLTTVTSIALGSDTGTSLTDFCTNAASQTVSGTLSAVMVSGDIVQVSLDNGATWATASSTVGLNSWSLTGQTLSASNTIKVRVADAAGNAGAEASQAYVFDTSAPNASVTTATVSINTNVTTSLSSDIGVIYLVSTGVSVTDYASLEAAVVAGNASKSTVATGGTPTPIGTTAMAAGTYKVYAVDIAGNVSAASSDTITLVVNQLPVITSNGGGATAAISIPENTTGVTTVTSTDADLGQTPTYAITGGADQAKFTINGATGLLSLTSAPNFEAPSDNGANNTYVVDVTVSDGHSGTDVQTITVTVTNANDVHAGGVSIAGTPAQGQTLSAVSTLTDEDGMGTISYLWSAGGVAIPGATGSSFVLGQGQVGQTISVTARYTDAQGTAESATSAASAAVANVNDAPTGGVTISGTATQGQTLTAANTLADADGPTPLVVSYQWQANGVDISGATGSTFAPSQAQVGQSITVVARYTDAFGAVESKTSNASAAVANVNDAPTGGVTISGTATQGQTLTASNTLADADGIPTSGSGAISYVWSAGGVVIAGATGSSYTLTQAEVGKTIAVTAHYIDLLGTAESMASASSAAVISVSTVTTPQGGSTLVENTNGGTTAIVAPATGSTVTATSSGDTTVTDPGSVVTLNNTGGGTVTVTGLQGDTTLNLTGSGAQHVDLSGLQAGDVLTIDNTGSGKVDLSNLPDGVIVQLLGTGPIVLNDSDGVSQSVEDKAPAMPSGKVGDGNGDGVPDALQTNVASIPFLETPTALSNPGNAPPVFVSLVADAKDGKIDTTNNSSATLSNVHQLDAPANLPAEIKMPLGLIAFNANVSTGSSASVGTTETFSLYVDASLQINGYWKQNAAGTWVNLASVAYGGQVITEGGKTRLDFKITDGGEFDADHAVNGVIVDPGSAGFMPMSVVGYSTEAWVSVVGYSPAIPAQGYWF